MRSPVEVLTVVMDQGSTPGRSLSGTWVPPVVLDEPGGVGDHDPVPSCSDHAVLAQLAQDPNDDLPSRPDGLREFPLADLDDKLGSRRALRSWFGQALGRQVEQMPGHALADRGERTAGDLPDETQHPFAQLTEKRYGDSHVP